MNKNNLNIKNRNEPTKPKIMWLVIAIIVILLAWITNLGWGIWAMDNDPSKGGQWGDIFGAVNALFSGITLAFLTYGIWMQRYEVDLAKAELAQSKMQTQEIIKQSEEQKIAFDKQNEATERQMFENSFFILLREFNEFTKTFWIYKPISISNGDYIFNNKGKEENLFVGKDIFFVLSEFTDRVFINYHINYLDLIEDKYQNLKEIYNHKFKEPCKKLILSLYLEQIKFIFLTILNAKEENRDYYFKLFRAQLSKYEIKVIAFYLAFSIREDEFYVLFFEKKFLENCTNDKNEIEFINSIKRK